MAEPWESDTVVEEEPTTPQAQPWDQDPAVEEPKKEGGIVANALAGAGDVIKGFAQQFVPKFDTGTLASLAYGPINAQIQGYHALKSITDTAEQVQEAEKTEPFSRERFGAGFNVAGQLGLLALGGRAKPAEPKLAEVAGFEKPTEAMPQAPEPTISETVPPITETIKEEVIPNASEITSPESVTQPEVRPRVGEETPLRQQGETPTEEVVPIETQEVVEPVPQPEQPAETGSGLVSKHPGEMTEQEFLRYYKDKGFGKSNSEGALERGLQMNPDELYAQGLSPENMAVADFRNMHGGYQDQLQNTGSGPVSPAPEAATTAEPLPKTEVTTPEAPPPISPPEVKSLTPDSLPVEVGPNVKGFEEVYGPGEIKPGESITPEELFRNGKADLDSGKIDPYAIADRARTGDVSPRELGALAAEHDRLLHEAAAFEGTPGYEERYQAAKTFAQNMLKPAGTKWHQTGIGLQVKAPIDLSNLTGFRAAFEARFNKEMSPAQAEPFSKMAKDVARAKAEDSIELGRTAERVQQRFKGVKDIPFEDAVKSLHEAIKTALKDCNL